ncbi:hypothetical protein HL653_22065 [Sphingomonas sp. AP4-R1]|uniref:hypothetical protein n=1 Tax=Sphingomonas sp. AP4-R1 TaxID=2735134 RepID=UPI001493BEC4|nr:hypothetical protein [Sphingomonas sp. AP4-R1]QJU56375.1 hypothetical protein HL653_22065 [Sphingomonas sp. AP4-R1]
MALNFLLHRHQVSLMREAQGASPEARASHRGLAAGYARRIGELSASSGAPFAVYGVADAIIANAGHPLDPSETPDRGMAD